MTGFDRDLNVTEQLTDTKKDNERGPALHFCWPTARATV
jgi:hypothetical protein